MFIRTQRLFLRPIWAEDWPAILALITDGAAAGLPGPASSALSNPRCPLFLITRPRGAQGCDLLGVIGLGEDAGEVTLGFWLAEEHRGQGYAGEAARAVLGLARVLGHRRIAAYQFPDNPAAGRVLERLGFRALAGWVGRLRADCGMPAPARRHVLDLALPGNCDDEGPVRRAA